MRKAIEITVEVLLALGLVFVIVSLPKNAPIDGKWVAFAINTILVFGFVVYWHKPLTRKGSFWLRLTAFLVIHIIVLTPILMTVNKLPLVLYCLIIPGEWTLMLPFFDSLVEKSANFPQ